MSHMHFVHGYHEPSSASIIDIARPLPMPSPAQPAPVTMATLPFRPLDGGSDGISVILVNGSVLEMTDVFLG